jgi:hypothetical protein
MGRLQVDPEVRACIESFGKEPGCFRCNATLAHDNFIYALHRYAWMRGKGDLGYSQEGKEFLP